MIVLVVGMSLAIVAQKDPPKQDRPPKPKPPEVEPGKPAPKPPKEDKPKKPEMSLFVLIKDEEQTFA
jgi:hypothetical protein